MTAAGEQNATTVIEPGWQATVTTLDHLLLERTEAPIDHTVEHVAAPIEATVALTTPCAPVAAPHVPATGTKLARAVIIYQRMAAAARKDVIAALVAELAMTPAGASTYYSNIKAGRMN